MVRDLARLPNEAFDVLVIGGGIYGLAILRELTARGLRTALVERADFAAATSFNSLKTVHGGIRALQHGALGDMREFVRERRALARLAPHLVRPLPFVVPTHRHPVRNRAVMSLFLAAYDLLAADRNAGVEAHLALPASRTVSRDECLRLNPFIDPDDVTGGAVWYDYQLHSPERLAIGLLAAAVRAGAAAANYTKALQFLQQGRQVRGARVRDELTGADFELRARCTVNAAGPWAWPLLREAGALPAATSDQPMSLAMNVIIDQPPASHAAGGLADGRFLFLVPWRDRSIVGTSHDEFRGAPDDLVPDERRVEAFLSAAARAFPRANLTRAGVRLVHRGLLPAARGAELLKRSVIRDHAADGVDGLVTLLGVRYTTARATAAAAADLVAAKLGRPSGPAAKAMQPIADARAARIAGLTREVPALAAPLGASCPVMQAAIVDAARHEMAVHLSDALLRRTEAGTAGYPGDDAVASAAAVMGRELAWTAAQTSAEIEAVERAYRDMGAAGPLTST